MTVECPGPAHIRGAPNDPETEHEYVQWCLAMYGEVVWVDDFDPSPDLPACELPNHGGGWADHWPIPGAGHRPASGVPVVYQLHEAFAGPPVYIGSTSRFWRRMVEHESSGRYWTWWTAEPCADRAHAYRREGELIDALQPRDNIVGRHT